MKYVNVNLMNQTGKSKKTIFVLQIESHPYLNNKKLIDFCGEHGIVTVAYSPLGSPQRSWAKPDDPVLLEQPKLKEIAAKYSRSVSQVVLRFQVCMKSCTVYMEF